MIYEGLLLIYYDRPEANPKFFGIFYQVFVLKRITMIYHIRVELLNIYNSPENKSSFFFILLHYAITENEFINLLGVPIELCSAPTS